MEISESGQDVLPLTCWSRPRHPHLGSRLCSGSPLNRLLLSGALTRPVGHGHTQWLQWKGIQCHCKPQRDLQLPVRWVCNASFVLFTSKLSYHAFHTYICVSMWHVPAVLAYILRGCFHFHLCVFLTRRDQMFMRPPTPPDARARPSGLKASVLTGVMWPLSWKTHIAPSPDHREDCNTGKEW